MAPPKSVVRPPGVSNRSPGAEILDKTLQDILSRFGDHPQQHTVEKCITIAYTDDSDAGRSNAEAYLLNHGSSVERLANHQSPS